MAADRAPVDWLRAWFRAQATDAQLRAKRLQTAELAASYLDIAGRVLRAMDDVRGAAHVDGRRGGGDDARVAVGVLAQISSSLLDASAALLCGRNHYAGAALVRQIVEVEYLSWAIANRKRDAASWLNSTLEERLKFFAPARLRELGGEKFRAVDYRDHCEQGGHPVPRGVPLLTDDVGLAQLLLIDLLLHTWRTTDNFYSWGSAADLPANAFTAHLQQARQAFNAWSGADPLYEWVCNAPPPPDPGP